MIVACVIGVALGVYALVLHLLMDPMSDVRVYWEAGTRLNQGQPLYDVAASDSFGLYLNPPLLAIVFRPLALLPFRAAAAIWLVVITCCLGLTLRQTGLRRPVWIALAILAEPIAWSFAIGQSEPVLTLMLTLAMPASVAVAGYLKVVPWLAAAYWLVRRDLRALARFIAWVIGLGVAQLILEPAGTLAWLQLTWLRPAFMVHNISPFAIHPLLWVVMLLALGLGLWRFRRTRLAWPFAVGIAVLAYPRLLVYQLMSLLAVFGGPRDASPDAAAHAASRGPAPRH